MAAPLALDMRLAVNTVVHNLCAAGVDTWRNRRWTETQNADYLRAKELLVPKLIVRGLLPTV